MRMQVILNLEGVTYIVHVVLGDDKLELDKVFVEKKYPKVFGVEIIRISRADEN